MAAALLAGAEGVESADIVAGAERVEHAVLQHPDADALFIEFRRTVVRRRTAYELRKAEARAHVLEGQTVALANIDEVKSLGFSETFIRMWEYYLCYCEGGFAERYIGAGL